MGRFINLGAVSTQTVFPSTSNFVVKNVGNGGDFEDVTSALEWVVSEGNRYNSGIILHLSEDTHTLHLTDKLAKNIAPAAYLADPTEDLTISHINVVFAGTGDNTKLVFGDEIHSAKFFNCSIGYANISLDVEGDDKIEIDYIHSIVTIEAASKTTSILHYLIDSTMNIFAEFEYTKGNETYALTTYGTGRYMDIMGLTSFAGDDPVKFRTGFGGGIHLAKSYGDAVLMYGARDNTYSVDGGYVVNTSMRNSRPMTPLYNNSDTDGRPTYPIKGTPWFDTEIGKPIWCKTEKDGDNDAVWVDANGEEV